MALKSLFVILIVTGLSIAMPFNGPLMRQDIRNGMNLNTDTGVSASKAMSNNFLINGGSNPGLKVSQGLASDITIRGPLGTVSDDFHNVASTGTNAGDIGQSFATGGQFGRNVGSMTGVNIALHNDRPWAPSQAVSNNNANTFSFGNNNGGRRRGGGTNFFGQSNAMGMIS